MATRTTHGSCNFGRSGIAISSGTRWVEGSWTATIASALPWHRSSRELRGHDGSCGGFTRAWRRDVGYESEAAHGQPKSTNSSGDADGLIRWLSLGESPPVPRQSCRRSRRRGHYVAKRGTASVRPDSPPKVVTRPCRTTHGTGIV